MQHSFLKTNLTEKLTFPDLETGEIKEETIKSFKYLANTKEEFFIAYSSMLSIIYKQLSLPEIKIYAYLLENYNFGSVIGINKAVKEEMGTKIDLKIGTINNTLSKLVDKKLLFSSTRGGYKLNPRYAFKGSTKERNQLLKATLELECPDC